MPWRYYQSSGDLERLDDFGAVIVTLTRIGYSGHGVGLNNPAMQDVENTGPIPRGEWSIGAPYDSRRVGPFALPLAPAPSTVTFARSAFLIHGDNIHRDRSASEGCIILPRRVREAIHDSDDSTLFVVA